MDLFNIMYFEYSQKISDQVYANSMIEACAMAHLKHGVKVRSVSRA